MFDMFDAPGKMTASIIASLVMLASVRADAQSGANVLVVVNDASATARRSRNSTPDGAACPPATSVISPQLWRKRSNGRTTDCRLNRRSGGASPAREPRIAFSTSSSRRVCRFESRAREADRARSPASIPSSRSSTVVMLDSWRRSSGSSLTRTSPEQRRPRPSRRSRMRSTTSTL